MKLVERHYTQNPKLNEITHKSKNIYNRANYLIKEHYYETKEYLNYYELDKLMQNEECYQALPRKVSQQTLRLLDRNWRSFFVKIKVDKKARPPKYLPKDGNFITVYTKQAINKGNKLSQTDISLTTNKVIQEVRIIPKKFGIIIEIVYNKQPKTKEPNDRFLSIDLGLNNLVAITSDYARPTLVNGRPLKSINQYYNKKPTKQRLKKRYFQIENYFHHTSRLIINYCLKYNISKVIIGYNEGWKQEINMGKENNQHFCFLPLLNLVNKIKYKSELEGISVILTEEAHTSKSSFFDRDPLPTYDVKVNYSGNRIKRGLYRMKDKFKINSDVNGALNIGRKVIHDWLVDRSLVARPLKVNPLRTLFV